VLPDNEEKLAKISKRTMVYQRETFLDLFVRSKVLTISGFVAFFIIVFASFITVMKIHSFYLDTFVFRKMDPKAQLSYMVERSGSGMGVYILASIALNIVVGFFLSDTSVNEIGNDMLVIFGFALVPTDMLSAFLTNMFFN
jgi:hypothetical protein